MQLRVRDVNCRARREISTFTLFKYRVSRRLRRRHPQNESHVAVMTAASTELGGHWVIHQVSLV